MVTGRQSAVLDLISQGEYYYASNFTTSLTRTLDTVSATDLYDNSGGSKDVVVSWVRVKFFTGSATAPTPITLIVYKLLPGESTPTWNSATIQTLRDSGRLFFMKTWWQMTTVAGPLREQNMEFFNVKLRVGEKLVLGEIYKTTVNDAKVGYVLERRVLDVGV